MEESLLEEETKKYFLNEVKDTYQHITKEKLMEFIKNKCQEFMKEEDFDSDVKKYANEGYNRCENYWEINISPNYRDKILKHGHYNYKGGYDFHYNIREGYYKGCHWLITYNWKTKGKLEFRFFFFIRNSICDECLISYEKCEHGYKCCNIV